ncbi:MAG: hypothetical protein EOP39_27530, partial [Rubrivivax sp.]
MKAIPPVAITPYSSSIAEPAGGESVWVSGHAYVAGDIAILTATHRRYECTVAITGAISPDVDAAHWRDAGPTNKWAMFDIKNKMQTVATGTALVVEIAPGRRINSICLRGLNGASVRIEMHVGAASIYDRTINLLLRRTLTWSQYMYGAFRVLTALVRFDLPMSTGAVIKITVQPTAGDARCAAVVLGMSEDLGTIIDEPVSDRLGFSKFDRDEFAQSVQARRVRADRVVVLRHAGPLDEFGIGELIAIELAEAQSVRDWLINDGAQVLG